MSENPLIKIPQAALAAVKRRAKSAFTRVAGAYVPAVLSRSQSAKDDREADSQIMAAVAKRAAEIAADDPEIVQRMVANFADEQIRKQQNRENVAQKAAQYLDDDAAQKPSADDADTTVDDDWINTFSAHAEKASSENLRDMWARVLAGEIRKPGAFSLVTLHLVALLDKAGASIINTVMPWVIRSRSGIFIPHDAVEKETGLNVGIMVFLEDLGFLAGSAGGLILRVQPEGHGKVITRVADAGFVIDTESKPISFVHAYPLTLAGRQLSTVIASKPATTGIAAAFLRAFPEAKSIEIGRVTEPLDGPFSVVDLTRFHPVGAEPEAAPAGAARTTES